jgi:hypothetical protein
MKKFPLYFISSLLSVLVGYFVNQLPNLPDQLKPWVPAIIAVLVLITAIVLIQQGGGERVTSKTVIEGNELAGKRSTIKATDAEVRDNRLTGDGSSISTNDRDPGQNP